jgi:MFS transporter, AAHS family, 3-hydroxyphenylpropionic acid transporter
MTKNVATVSPSAPTRAGTNITLILCSAAAILEGFDNQSIGVAAPRLTLEFALTEAQKGFIFSAATFGLFLGAALGGRIADIVGRKRTLVTSLFLFGALSILTALAQGPDSLFVARLLTGLGLGGALPNFIALSSEAVDPRRRVSAVTVVMAGMPFGGALAALIALGDHWNIGWRAIFYFGGVAPVLLALIMQRALPESGSGEAHLATEVPAGTSVAVESISKVLFGSNRAPTTLLLWAAFFFTQLVLLLMLNWLPSLILGLGFSRTQASWASVCFNVCGSLGAIVLGRVHAGEHRRFWVVLTYTGIALALAAVPAMGGKFFLVAAACGLAGIFIIGAQLVLFALGPLYYPHAIRGTGVGSAVAIGRLGSVVGPLYASILLAAGSSSAAVLTGIVPFVIAGGCAALALTWRVQTGK